MRARPWLFCAFVVTFFLAVFRIDVAVGLGGQLVLGAVTWFVFGAALVPLTPEGRVRALLVVAAATCMEVIGSIILGVYTYRLGNLPLFVPRGHGLLSFTRRALLGLPAATGMEVIGSIIWGVYTYRLGNLPLFVPPGHGLVYLTGLSLTQTGLVSRHQRTFLLAVGAIAIGWGSWGLARPAHE